mmetsp:Transcript_57317/g.134094  ORF Transcript_57317/g.134094 Transcript_57317/m.134094 type:complete len:209 (+) Transcript_57317:371-997(+)
MRIPAPSAERSDSLLMTGRSAQGRGLGGDPELILEATGWEMSNAEVIRSFPGRACCAPLKPLVAADGARVLLKSVLSPASLKFDTRWAALSSLPMRSSRRDPSRRFNLLSTSSKAWILPESSCFTEATCSLNFCSTPSISCFSLSSSSAVMSLDSWTNSLLMFLASSGLLKMPPPESGADAMLRTEFSMLSARNFWSTTSFSSRLKSL